MLHLESGMMQQELPEQACPLFLRTRSQNWASGCFLPETVLLRQCRKKEHVFLPFKLTISAQAVIIEENRINPYQERRRDRPCDARQPVL